MAGSPRFRELEDELWELHQVKSGDYGSQDDPLENIHAQKEMDYTGYDGAIIELSNIQRRLRNLIKALRRQPDLRTSPKFRKDLKNALIDKAAFSFLATITFEEDGILIPGEKFE